VSGPPAAHGGEAARRRHRAHRWVRQLHLWIGAWGALAAVLYGFTGLVMNHRFGDAAWPQGSSVDTGRVALQVPDAARTSPEALSLWLRQAHGFDAQVIRKGSSAGAGKWTLSGGSARSSWALDYAPGSTTADIKQSRQSLLAAFGRLHKAVGGGWAWRLLADSFAIGMLLLGLSGLWMWARGRSPRQWIASVFGLGLVVAGAVLLPALL
jgi:uncharacterized protein